MLRSDRASTAGCARCWVLMGVSGCGKSLIGQLLAQRLQIGFLEGDDFHSLANIEKMRAGTALDDADRHAWLLLLQRQLSAAQREGNSLVLSCSALKRSYRDLLRHGNAALVFVHLAGDHREISARLAHRSGHFMAPGLLASQFSALEPLGAGEHGLTLAIDQAPARLVDLILGHQR